MIQFGHEELFLVTGASSGIGREIVLRIIQLGGRAVGVGRDKTKLDRTSASVKDPSALITEARDLSHNNEELDKWLLDVAQRHGRLKGMVLCAGQQQITPLKAFDLKNAKELFSMPDVDGGLIGGASLNADEFVGIIKAAGE